METDLSLDDAWAMLDWQVELGADEAIFDTPVNRFELPAAAPTPAAAPGSSAARSQAPVAPVDPGMASPIKAPSATAEDAVALADRLASAASDLPALRAALEGFDRCDLRDVATRLVFADGNPDARVMIIGEAPGRDEDRRGRPFVGRAGQLLDRMLAAIGLSRTAEDPARAVYITNMLPWRPPQNRDPRPDELAMLSPFVRRHVELANPELLIMMGNHACAGLIGRSGITRLRGTWHEVMGRPACAMFHPAYLLRNPLAKRESWADLLDVSARLKGG